MKRLTIDYKGQNVLKDLCNFDVKTNEIELCKTCMDICTSMSLYSTCDRCPIQMCFERLAAYESTGLSPKQVKKLKKKLKKISNYQ